MACRGGCQYPCEADAAGSRTGSDDMVQHVFARAGDRGVLLVAARAGAGYGEQLLCRRYRLQIEAAARRQGGRAGGIWRAPGGEGGHWEDRAVEQGTRERYTGGDRGAGQPGRGMMERLDRYV